MLIAVTIGIAFSVAPAQAQEAMPRVDELLAEGWEAYTELLEFERAVEAYEAATEHPDATDTQLIEAFEYLAACRYALGNEEGAREALRQLLHIDPDKQLHDPSHSPDFLLMLEDLRSELPPEPPPMPDPPAEEEVPPGMLDETEVPEDNVGEDRPWYRTWWFWTITGVVVAGAVTTGIVVGTRDPAVQEPPGGSLGPGVVQLPCTLRF